MTQTQRRLYPAFCFQIQQVGRVSHDFGLEPSLKNARDKLLNTLSLSIVLACPFKAGQTKATTQWCGLRACFSALRFDGVRHLFSLVNPTAFRLREKNYVNLKKEFNYSLEYKIPRIQACAKTLKRSICSLTAVVKPAVAWGECDAMTSNILASSADPVNSNAGSDTSLEGVFDSISESKRSAA